MNLYRAGGALNVAVGVASERGPRPENEDFAAVSLETRAEPHGVVAAIADGVGGAKGGRIAAELAVRMFIEGYQGQSEIQGVQQSAGRALQAANSWIHAQGRADPNLTEMQCTLSAAIVRARRLHVLHVGDTRLYRLRGQTLSLLTNDHRPERSAIPNQLTRALGAEETVRIDYADEAVEPHDRILLCSDGVHDALSDRRIEEELGRRSDPDETARRLVAAALESGGGDNATALILDVLELPVLDADGFNQVLANLPILPAPQIGATIDEFQLIELLADGRYSRVFAARDLRDHQQVVIKFPKPLAIGAEASARGAFLRESWVASRVRSPWVGAVLDLPVARRSCLYLVQPYYEGETLEQRLRRKPPIELETGLEIAQKLSKAVAALHRAGIVHRDIKPDNIILEPHGGVKLIDLGVARLPHLESWPLAENPGTPSYKAPELFAGANGDERSDLFALGVTLYRMFSGGAYPYGEIEPFQQPRFRRPTPLAAHRPNLPSWLDIILARAIAPVPQDRMADVIELAFELEHGAIKGAPAYAQEISFYRRHALAIWKGAAIVLALLLGLALIIR